MEWDTSELSYWIAEMDRTYEIWQAKSKELDELFKLEGHSEKYLSLLPDYTKARQDNLDAKAGHTKANQDFWANPDNRRNVFLFDNDARSRK